MSSEENTQEERFLVVEPLKEVMIEGEDALNVLQFFKAFEATPPKTLEDAITAFVANPTTETQNAFRVELCAALMNGTEPVFQDEVFQLINQNTRQVVYHHEFNKQLEETLKEGS
jgi:hypothetical protein